MEKCKLFKKNRGSNFSQATVVNALNEQNLHAVQTHYDGLFNKYNLVIFLISWFTHTGRLRLHFLTMQITSFAYWQSHRITN